MATKLEEMFLNRFVKDGDNVLEFGPGNCVWAKSRSGVVFTGVDLYPPESQPPPNMNYVRGNLLDVNLGQTFDTAACLSSFEHAGIEQPHFKDNQIDLQEHEKIAHRLVNLVKPGGLVLLTMPGGKPAVYAVNQNGSYGAFDSLKVEHVWGFRTFNLQAITQLFPGLKLLDAQAYALLPEHDYFQNESWTKISLTTLDTLDYQKQHGLLMVAFQKDN